MCTLFLQGLFVLGMPIEKALEYGNVAGALATTVRGDIEAQPT